MPTQGKVAVIALLVICLGAHEAAHAWTALKCGDTTGRDQGRITLNPIPHIDPVMTVVMPVLLVMTTGMLFGGARPVPVNFYNLRRPHRDMALVAIAGPLSNVLSALVLYAAFHTIESFGAYEDKLLPTILKWAAIWNLLLAAFNLFPIPPLDGSRVMAWILPRSLRPAYMSLERFGILIVFGLFILAPGAVYGPLMATLEFLYRAMHWIVTLGGLW
jgi:Zn-dependent protease